MASAIRRISEMVGHSPSGMPVEARALREKLQAIHPARFGVSAKTFSNLRSLVAAALRLAGVLDDMSRGLARRDPLWGPLLQKAEDDRRIAEGLATFANWCAANGVFPQAVDDSAVRRFGDWLESRTHCPKPKDVIRRTPLLWNEASSRIDGWPTTRLSRVSFKPPLQHMAWDQFPESFREDAEIYLARRANPDVFDEAACAPRLPLAPTTLSQQREHIRLAASVLIQAGRAADEIVSFAALVERENVKTVLRHYHARGKGRPNAFAIALSKTLLQIAKHHVGLGPEALADLRTIASKLPSVPFDLTSKNKELLRQLEPERLRATLLFLPEETLASITTDKESLPRRFVEAQVAIALDILLAIPLRAQNLCSLHWRRHFAEPEGPRGRLILHIPAEETKAKHRELAAEVPADVARRLRWYRRNVLPRLGADPDGCLFVTRTGTHKSQQTLSQQIREMIEERVGVTMTPHQFRHFAAYLYLEANPEDQLTVHAMLHHASSKTTLIYAGAPGRRASRAYGKALFAQREKLKLARGPRKITKTTGS
jgi:integrase